MVKTNATTISVQNAKTAAERNVGASELANRINDQAGNDRSLVDIFA
ncbi:MAG: hypothetical protein Q8O94_03045 [bacterium]|nr:hypothetical protein [bacterium]